MLIGGCAQASAPIVARVGEAVITRQQLAHWTLLRAPADHPSSGQRGQTGNSVLAFLIKARWLEGWAGVAGVAATKLEAARQLSLFEYARLRGLPVVPFEWEDEFKPYLRSPAATASDRLWLITLSTLRKELHRRELAQAEEAVTPSEIKRYYRAQPHRFFVPEMRDIAIMESYSLPAMVKARHELAAGIDAEVVARRLSMDPVDPNGLKSGYARGPGAPALDNAIFSARPNTVVGPLQVAMYYVFEVRAIRRRHRLALAEVSGRIKAELADKTPREALDRSFQTAWTSRTACRPGYVVLGCKRDQAVHGGAG